MRKTTELSPICALKTANDRRRNYDPHGWKARSMYFLSATLNMCPMYFVLSIVKHNCQCINNLCLCSEPNKYTNIPSCLQCERRNTNIITGSWPTPALGECRELKQGFQAFPG
jgi:hypothetical protein